MQTTNDRSTAMDTTQKQETNCQSITKKYGSSFVHMQIFSCLECLEKKKIRLYKLSSIL